MYNTSYLHSSATWHKIEVLERTVTALEANGLSVSL